MHQIVLCFMFDLFYGWHQRLFVVVSGELAFIFIRKFAFFWLQLRILFSEANQCFAQLENMFLSRALLLGVIIVLDKIGLYLKEIILLMMTTSLQVVVLAATALQHILLSWQLEAKLSLFFCSDCRHFKHFLLVITLVLLGN